MRLRVLYSDNHIIAVSKPAGLLTQSDATGRRNLLDMVKDYRKRTESKPGNVYVGMLHRLDRPVSGVIVFARTSKCASRLSNQFRCGTVAKSYLAVVEAARRTTGRSREVQDQTLHEETGIWRDSLSECSQHGKVSVLRSGDDAEPTGLRRAETRWTQLASERSLRLLELRPTTGRRHQLRAQCADRGTPIFGDRTYGSVYDFGDAIALHASWLRFEHPTRRTPVAIRCPIPDSWQRFPFRFPDDGTET